VLGTGNMGLPVARRLAQAGHRVRAWNRTHARAAPLSADGITVCKQARDAARWVDCAISLLENGDVVGQVLFDLGAAAALPAGSLFIDMASIQPGQAREHAQRLRAMGLRYLDAPVSGGTVGAEAGTLAIMAGGAAADFAQADAIFRHLGRATLVGPHGSGQLAKTANQMIVGPPLPPWPRPCCWPGVAVPTRRGCARPLPAVLPTAACCNCTAHAWCSATLPRAHAFRYNAKTCTTPYKRHKRWISTRPSPPCAPSFTRRPPPRGLVR